MLLALPLSTDVVPPLLKTMITQVWFALDETILALSNHFPVFHMLQHIFQDDLFLGSKEEPFWSVVPRVLLIILSENVCSIQFSSVIAGTTWLQWLFNSHSAYFYASWSFANTYIQKMLMEFEAENVGTIVLLHFLENFISSYLQHYFYYLIDKKTCEKSFYIWKEFMCCTLFIGVFIDNAAKYADTVIKKAISLLHRTKQLCLQ